MERKWIGPQDYWRCYKEVDGKFFQCDSQNPSVWQDTFWSSWKEIENMHKDVGFVEDLHHNQGLKSGQALKELENLIIAPGFITYRKGWAAQPDPTNFSHFCKHTWATYTGFNKVEIYCTKCKEVQK